MIAHNRSARDMLELTKLESLMALHLILTAYKERVSPFDSSTRQARSGFHCNRLPWWLIDCLDNKQAGRKSVNNTQNTNEYSFVEL